MTNWDPWRDLFGFPREVSQLWNGPASGIGASNSAPALYLPLDIRQTEKEFILEASVPGFSPDGIEVVAEHGILTIRGERKVEAETEGRYLRRERRQLSFFRQISLPQDVSENEISANFVNGVLTVRVPRVETPAPRRVKIEVGSNPATLEADAALAEVTEAISQS
jgi:HSP20 family protein